MHPLPVPVPEFALSQVVFVHDYMQFVFQDEVLTIYNAIRITTDGVQYVQTGPGFADQAVRLIESKVVSVAEARGRMLELHFQNGACVQVPVGQANATGPEAYMFCGKNGSVIVEPNP